MLQNAIYCSPRSSDVPAPDHSKIIKFQLCKQSSQESIKAINLNIKCDMEKRLKSSSIRSTGRKGLIEANMPTVKSKSFTPRCDYKKSRLESRPSSRCQTPKSKGSYSNSPENSMKNMEKKYDSGDYIMLDGKLRKSNDDVIKCLNSFGQNVKINSTVHNLCNTKFDDSVDSIEESQQRVDMIFSEKKKEFLTKTESDSSIIESGYLTNSNNSSKSTNHLITYETNQVDLKHCNSQTDLYCPTGEIQNEQVCEAVIKLFGTNAKLAKLLQGSIEYTNSEGRPVSIVNELKKCLNKETTIEENLDKYLSSEANTSKRGSPRNDENYFYDLKNLDESMTFVKENLTSIREELNEFKENCWSKIESKVNKTEFSDVTGSLRSKMGHIERRILNEQKLIKQDLMYCKEKLKKDSMSQCGIRSFPFWPFIAFLGAYSIMYFGNKT